MKKLLLSILAITTVSAMNAQLVENGLILHYEMGTGGYTDASGNGNDSPSAYLVTDDTDRFGNTTGAGYIEQAGGVVAHIQLPDSILLPLDRSVSLWFKTNRSQGGVLLGMQNTDLSSTPNHYVPVMYSGSDSLAYGQFWSGSTSVIGSVNKKTDNSWHHIVLTSDATGQKLYLDDTLQGSLGVKVLLNTMKYSYVGVGYTSASWTNSISATGYNTYSGSSVDDLRIYDRAISASEVDSLFHENGYMGWLGVNETRTSMTSIYPNPVSGVLNIQTDEIINSVRVFSLSGQLLLKSIDRQINVEDLVNGVYIVSVVTESGISTQRFIKE